MAGTETNVPRLEISRFDDPRVAKAARTEDYSLHAVPRSWRNSRPSLAMAFYAILSAMFYLIVSATTALAVGSVNTIIGMAAAALATGVINYFISAHATRTGLSVALFSRSMFGQLAAALATLIFGATAVYYAVFEGSVIAAVFHEYFGGLPLQGWYLVVVLYSIPLVIGGVRVWLDKVNGVLLPFYCVGIAAAIIMAIAAHGYSNEWLTFQPGDTGASAGPGWIFAFTVYMGVWVQMMFTMDYARYGRPADERFNGIVTFGPVFYLLTWLLNGLIGLFLLFTIPTRGELTETSGVLGIVSLLGVGGVIFVWASQTRINTANYYLASTNLQSFFARVFKLRLPRVAWVGIVGIVVFAIMLTDVFSYILQALRVQGVFVVSWVGIAIAQIAYERLRRSGAESEFRPGRVPLVNPAGVIAWLSSTAVGIYLLFGAGAFGATWAPPITFVLAVGIYGVALEFARRRWFLLSRPHDPRDEVDDPWEDRVLCDFCGRSYIAYEMDRHPGSGHRPICAECASANTSLYREARREAATFREEPASQLSSAGSEGV
ncbi:MAG: thiamine permease [Streptosporangiales bacterium]|nr:thiamine permease [Streptosporangiales bacterium]